jgi:hypothetical protein
MRVLVLLLAAVLLSPLAASGRSLPRFDPDHPTRQVAPAEEEQEDTSGAQVPLVIVVLGGLLALAAYWAGMFRQDPSRAGLAPARELFGSDGAPLFEKDPWAGEVHDVLPVIAQGWVEQLRLGDPAFDVGALLERVKDVYLRTQEALFLRRLAPVRALMSDATYQRFGTRLALLEDAGLREALDEVRVAGVQLVGFRRSDWYDTLHVAVDVRLRRKRVPAGTSDEEARRLAAGSAPVTFTDVWSFVRKIGNRTVEGGLLQGKCPQCGAPFQGGQTNQCGYCQAIVNSGNFDWTLAEITAGGDQGEALREPEIAGLGEARAADPALNLQILEDRASLVFWKWIEARAMREPRRLAKLAAPALLRALREPAAFRGLEVTGVDTQSFRHGSATVETTVEVRWRGQVGPGEAARLDGSPAWTTVSCRTRLRLARAHGARTRTGNGMSTSRCPACNAPLGESLTARCDYCDAALGADGADWFLVGEESLNLSGNLSC